MLFCLRHADCFPGVAKAPAPIKPGRSIHIETGNAQPIKVGNKGRRWFHATTAEVRDTIRFWLAHGIVMPSQLPWSAPIVVARKKMVHCACVLTIANSMLSHAKMHTSCRVSRTVDLLSELLGAKIMSSIDMAPGYNQVLSPGSKQNTAFTAPWGGLYEFDRAPFGLSCLPGQFSRLMAAVLHEDIGIYAQVFFDDVLNYSRSYAEHLLHVDQILSALEVAGLQIAPHKCEMFKTSLKYTGELVSTEGRACDPDQLSARSEMRVPASRAELQSVIGCFTYHRQFIKKFAVIAEPLHRLNQTGVAYERGEEQEHAFNTLKKALCESPVLAYPNWASDEPFIIYSDGSKSGIGGVLAQKQEDGKTRPLAYCSARHSQREQDTLSQLSLKHKRSGLVVVSSSG